jgi:tRNA1Val (adenine37-N6)-methyltransferase
MKDYLQPDFYHFNQDSIELVRWILSRVVSAKDVLDLGAGCGIIGIELSRNLLPEQLTLVEAQKEFRFHLEDNVKMFLPASISVSIDMECFSDWKPQRQFDLIACNPPYFLPGHGKPSPSKERGNCRTFYLDGWEILMSKVSDCLSPQGQAFFCLRNDQQVMEIFRKLARRENFLLSETKTRELIFCQLSRLDKN